MPPLRTVNTWVPITVTKTEAKAIIPAVNAIFFVTDNLPNIRPKIRYPEKPEMANRSISLPNLIVFTIKGMIATARNHIET